MKCLKCMMLALVLALSGCVSVGAITSAWDEMLKRNAERDKIIAAKNQEMQQSWDIVAVTRTHNQIMDLIDEQEDDEVKAYQNMYSAIGRSATYSGNTQAAAMTGAAMNNAANATGRKYDLKRNKQDRILQLRKTEIEARR